MTLRLLCDEHVGKKSFYPRISNYAATRHVIDEPPLGAGADDSEIWRHAVSIGFNILTNDSDFRPNGGANPNNGTHPGIIYYDDVSWKRIVKGIQKIGKVTTSSKIKSFGERKGQIFYLPDGWS